MMNTSFFCTHWGNTLKFSDFCKQVKQAGYDGVEMDLPLQQRERNEIVQTLSDHGLLLIAQYWQSLERDFDANQHNYLVHLNNLVEANPLFINAQTGKDYFSLEQNMVLVDAAKQLSADTGIAIYHETHRGKFLFNIPTFLAAVKADKAIGLTLDISHWCTVHESFLEDQAKGVQIALQHAQHLHARIGHTQSPQVNDPRAPEWKEVVDQYLVWWKTIARIKQQNNQVMTITPEFGPFPYMPYTPYLNEPIASQWDINVHMMNLLKKELI